MFDDFQARVHFLETFILNWTIRFSLLVAAYSRFIHWTAVSNSELHVFLTFFFVLVST